MGPEGRRFESCRSDHSARARELERDADGRTHLPPEPQRPSLRGLSPEQAYSLGDAYIQSVESAASLSDLTAIGPAMYDDFVRRVHKCRTNPRLSAQIQKCCDYIEMNLDKKVQAADLAALAGYTEYYLTRKFKAEVGCSVADYAKFAKVERAKVLLAGGGQSVQDIASQLGFGSRNYFSSTFRLITGHSPAQYREAHFGG